MLTLPGHTIFLAVKQSTIDCRITLECTCGRVLHGAAFVVDDANHRQAVRDEGHAKAVEHLNAEQAKTP